MVKVHEEEDADLIWRTIDVISPSVAHAFYHTSYDEFHRLMLFENGSYFTYNECEGRCEHLESSRQTGIRIPSIGASDAREKYMINLFAMGSNDNAVIYLFRPPDDAMLTSYPSVVIEGDDLSINCSCSSNSLPSASRPNVLMLYTWFRDSVELDPSALPIRHSFPESDQSLLLISDTDRADTGSYKCIGYENGSRLQSEESDTYVLDVLCTYKCTQTFGLRFYNDCLDTPGTAFITGDSEVVENENITLTCSTSDLGNPEGNYTWITPNGDTHLGDTLTVISLSIEEDEGEYECYVENHERGASDEHTLTVYYNPTIERDLPSIKTVYNTDESFSVSCSFRARPEADVIWMRKDGSPLPSNVFLVTTTTEVVGKYALTTARVGWSEADIEARRGQGGMMMCEASNEVREAVQSVTMDLRIYFSPYDLGITPESPVVELKEGNDLTERICSAICEPSCSFSWHFGSEDGPLISNSSRLDSMENVDRQRNGSYYCKAWNGIGTVPHVVFDLIVYYGPKILSFTSSPPDGSIFENDDANFSCSVDTRPGANIQLLGPEGLAKSVENETGLWHTLHGVTCMNSGTYSCWSNNSKTGLSDESTVIIKVKCAPSVLATFPEDRMHNASTGGSVSFSVDVLAYPAPEFQWRRILSNGSAVNLPSEDSDNRTTLTINKVKIEEYGNYYVSAYNSIGRWEDVLFQLVQADYSASIDVSLIGGIIGALLFMVIIIIGIIVFVVRSGGFKSACQRIRRTLSFSPAIPRASTEVDNIEMKSDEKQPHSSILRPGRSNNLNQCGSTQVKLPEIFSSRVVSRSPLRTDTLFSWEEIRSLPISEFGQRREFILQTIKPGIESKRNIARLFMNGITETAEECKKEGYYYLNVDIPIYDVTKRGSNVSECESFSEDNVLLLFEKHKAPLSEYLGRFALDDIDENNLRNVIVGIANGLSTIHQAGALMYKLTAESVLIADDNNIWIPKLSGFSTEQMVNERISNDYWTRKSQENKVKHCMEADVRDLGTLYLEILAVDEPYFKITDLRKQIPQGHLPEKPEKCTDEIYDIMRRCWAINPRDRPTAQRVAEEIGSLDRMINSCSLDNGIRSPFNLGDVECFESES
ncbi:hypothetical protein CAPTEDRAFT_202587 [Capitella teleta]|uniref:Receptor protein-tyrosine kinase n=1 Tax=Capitella teleta TaxID=283909 RepID=R7V9Y9_CAPTE|nr:hypothetical protein CAPTEDRAFT_202587 [Capitella teleta]|eukprot:ELU13146.1 hypothetical protein CAPTEDRAFT_202587 [Capitella teleta]